MESAGKQGSSDTSSEESDRVTTKRSYECTFCKRGFTNAQALGGHMNIHRKDRAKAKQRSTSGVPNRPINEEYYMNPRYVPTIPIRDPSKYYPILEAQSQMNYHMYFQQPGTSPRILPYGHSDCDFLAPASTMSQSLSFNEEISGVNLSLTIGPTNVDEDEVDLELRLGHDP